MTAPDKSGPPKSEGSRTYERGSWLGLGLIIGGGALYFLSIFLGIASSPEAMLGLIGVSGLMAAAGAVILFLKAVGDRMSSREDNYYSKNVDH
jgi:hypothetical protein